jgi:hypothetical protein
MALRYHLLFTVLLSYGSLYEKTPIDTYQQKAMYLIKATSLHHNRSQSDQQEE